MSASAQKRARQQLSCTACRTGKLRCNRQQPCDQCIKRSKDTSCQYLAPPPKKKHNRNTKDRIAHLEGLVVQLMNRDGTSDTSPPSSNTDSGSSILDGQSYQRKSPVQNNHKRSPESSSDPGNDTNASAFGQLTISKGEASYTGAAHWEAILEGIADVKGTLEDDEESEEEDEIDGQECNTLPMIMIGTTSFMTREMLLKSIPTKVVADKLLWHWFNCSDPSLPSIHRPSFLDQYQQLWKDLPSCNSITTTWMALLFAIMSLGARMAAYNTQNEPIEKICAELGSADHYQHLSAAALLLSDYTKPKRYTLEALMLHASCEHMKQEHNQLKLWLLMGTVVRVALRMGYHRDASHFPNVSPFDTEMRRRVWNLVYVFDVMQSYQLGLPSMIHQIQSDTQRPNNLLDSDFGPGSEVLPPERPLTEISSVSYAIVKASIVRVFARACDMSHAVQAPEYADVMEQDKLLQEVYKETPDKLKFFSMYQSILDPPAMIFHRFKLEMMFQKTRCILHRRYLTDEFAGTPMELSRKLCVEAGIKLLRNHETVNNAAQDGGQLSGARFYLSAFNAHDFLLGAMVLCVELDLISKAKSPAAAGPNADKVDEMRSLIETSYNIYKQPARHFPETEKAVKAMEVMLNKLGPSKETPAPNLVALNDYQGLEDLKLQAAANTLDPSLQFDTDMDLFDPNVFSPSQDMNWQEWDNLVMDNAPLIQNQSPNDQSLLWPSGLPDNSVSMIDDFGIHDTVPIPLYYNGNGFPMRIGAGVLPFD